MPHPAANVTRGLPPASTRSRRHAIFPRLLGVIVVGVVGLGVAAAATFAWGIALTWDFVRTLLEEGADSEDAVVQILEVIDTYLLATVLVILAVGLYELFIADLPAPGWLVIEDLADLKAKVSDVIVLLLAIKFLGKFLTVDDPLDALWYAIAVTLVGALLIAFRSIRSK